MSAGPGGGTSERECGFGGAQMTKSETREPWLPGSRSGRCVSTARCVAKSMRFRTPVAVPFLRYAGRPPSSPRSSGAEAAHRRSRPGQALRIGDALTPRGGGPPDPSSRTPPTTPRPPGPATTAPPNGVRPAQANLNPEGPSGNPQISKFPGLFVPQCRRRQARQRLAPTGRQARPNHRPSCGGSMPWVPQRAIGAGNAQPQHLRPHAFLSHHGASGASAVNGRRAV